MNVQRPRAVVAGVVAAVLAVTVLAGVMLGGDDEPDNSGRQVAPGGGAAQPDPGAPAGDGGGNPTVADRGDGPFNTQDVLFAHRIGAYQQQAIELAGIAAARGTNPEVKSLAQRIGGEQKAQHATADDRLRSWRNPAAVKADEDTSELPGMLTTDDVRGLAAKPAAEVDWTFLTMMIEHHLGAVTVAKQQQKQGKDPGALELARQIETTHTAQIATMKSLLGGS